MQGATALFACLAQRHFTLNSPVVISGDDRDKLIVILMSAQIALGAEHPNGDQHKEDKNRQATPENSPKQPARQLKQPLHHF
ncbi:hypothetical protein D3C73_1318710 [compost metagenome]